MGLFHSKLSVGDMAFGVGGDDLDPCVQRLTVGQLRVVQTHPKHRAWADSPCYVEEYMCFETGVGSGRVWTYGHDIFATEAEAEHGVIEHRQVAYKRRVERDARLAEEAERKRQWDLALLQQLKAQYES